MDFIHRPKCKILKILKNKNHNISEAGSASVLRWMEGEKGRTPILLGFSLSIRLRTEAEPAYETLWF
jgi:hypothetical protein